MAGFLREGLAFPWELEPGGRWYPAGSGLARWGASSSAGTACLLCKPEAYPYGAWLYVTSPISLGRRQALRSNADLAHAHLLRVGHTGLRAPDPRELFRCLFQAPRPWDLSGRCPSCLPWP